MPLDLFASLRSLAVDAAGFVRGEAPDVGVTIGVRAVDLQHLLAAADDAGRIVRLPGGGSPTFHDMAELVSRLERERDAARVRAAELQVELQLTQARLHELTVAGQAHVATVDGFKAENGELRSALERAHAELGELRQAVDVQNRATLAAREQSECFRRDAQNATRALASMAERLVRAEVAHG